MAKAGTRLLDRGQTYKITHTLGAPQFINWKCRPVLSKPTENVPVLEGYIYDLQGYMLSGKFAQSVVELPPCKLVATSTVHCYCHAYKYPHAPGFGACEKPKHEEVAPAGLRLEDLFPSGGQPT